MLLNLVIVVQTRHIYIERERDRGTSLRHLEFPGALSLLLPSSFSFHLQASFVFLLLPSTFNLISSFKPSFISFYYHNTSLPSSGFTHLTCSYLPSSESFRQDFCKSFKPFFVPDLLIYPTLLSSTV